MRLTASPTVKIKCRSYCVACIALIVTGGVSLVVVAVAWVLTVSRYLHTAIHIGGNRIRHRFPAFMVGYVATAFLWLALHLVLVVVASARRTTAA